MQDRERIVQFMIFSKYLSIFLVLHQYYLGQLDSNGKPVEEKKCYHNKTK